MIEDWNSVKQLTASLGLFAATFFVLDATASPACLFAATALPVAFAGVALHGPCPVGSSGSCFQYVPMGAVRLSAAMLAAIAFCLFMGLLPSLRIQSSLLFESVSAFQEGQKLSLWLRVIRTWMTQ